MIDRFKKYDEIIKDNKYNMLDLMIYYDTKCNELSENIPDNDLEYVIDFVYQAYLKDEEHIDLSYICDKALENKDDILENRDSDYMHFSVYDLLEKCV